MREIQALAASCTLLATSLIAHILAGGDSLSLYSGGALLVLSIAIARVMLRKSGDPIRMTVAIFIAQNFSHFILGGQARSDTAMFFAHITAGLLSYHLLRYFDQDLPALGRIFLRSITRTFSTLEIPVLLKISPLRTLPARFLELQLSRAFSLRAPPLY